MVNYTIPIGLLTERGILEKSLKDMNNKPDISSDKVMSSIKDKSVNHDDIVKEFFKQCSFCKSDNTIHECISILNAVYESKKSDEMTTSRFITNMGDILVNKIIPNTVNFDRVKQDISKLKESSSQELRKTAEKAENKVKEIEELSRVLENHNKVMKRFSVESVNRMCRISDSSSITNAVCEMVDTYDMKIHKKLNIALEESLFFCESFGKNYSKSDIVSQVLEYFLQSTDLISDKDYSLMESVFTNNHFITKEDTVSINYFFNEKSSFASRTTKLSQKMDGKYKDLIKEIANCSSTKGITLVIARSFDLIFSTFVVTGSAALTVVETLLGTLPALALIVGATPLFVISDIKKQFKEFKKRCGNLQSDEKERANKVITRVEKLIADADKAVKESAELIDQTILDGEDIDPSVTAIKEPEYAFNMIRDIMKESKDFADSEDVKDIIKKYKADQNKSESKMKRVLTKIYTKSPGQIIDELPNIFSLIRNFAILSTVIIPGIGPAVALVTFCIDKFISMKLKREETEKILKHFKSEKSKVAKKINSMKDGTKKERMEEYLQEIEQCIDKIDDYNRNLKSESEENLEDFLEEAVNLSFTSKIPLETFFNTKKDIVRNWYNRALQLIKAELIRLYPVGYDAFDYYKEKVDEAFENNDIFAKYYIAPGGLINIPLIKIRNYVESEQKKNMELVALDICSHVNNYLEDKCIVTSFTVGSVVYLTMYYTEAVDDGSQYGMDESSITHEGFENIAEFLSITEAVDEMNNELGVDRIVSELCENIDSLCKGDITSVTNAVINSKLDNKEFLELLKDYSYDCDNYTKNEEIKYCISQLEESNLDDIYNNLDSTIIQLESVRVLRSILEANKDKDTKEKGKAVDKVKDAIKDKAKDAKEKGNEAKDKTTKVVGNIANKTKDGKLAITTNLGLALEVMRKKVQGLSTKEKEISQSIDSATVGLKNGIEKAVTNDRREAIIKGSIIPSFSKLIKNAIMVGAAWAVNPALGAISCIGGLAISRSLNKKERQMLLDEINVELQVVESEIDRVKGEDPKKYKQLLMYQRKLQRERQRIMYKVKLYSKDKSSLLDPEY